MHDLLEAAPPTLEQFLTYWYGPPDRPMAAAPGPAGVLPGPTREWLEVTSQWSRPVSVQNQVMDDRASVVRDGKLLVWRENQGVWEWGVDTGGGDPEVYDRMVAPGEKWQRTGVSLSVFMVHVAVFEAVMGADHGGSAGWVSRDTCADILGPLRPIPHSEWRWPTAGSRLYAGDGILAAAGPNPAGDETAGTAAMSSVFVAGRDHRAVGHLGRLDGVEWDWTCWSVHDQ